LAGVTTHIFSFMKISKISVLTRPFSTKAFHFICERAFPDATVSYASDWRGVEDVWLMDVFYRVYRSRVATEALLEQMDVGDAVVADIVQRCRLLRTLPADKARRMVAAMWHAAESYLDTHDPDLLLTVHIDCYVYDVMARVQTRRGRPYLAAADSMLHDYGEVNYRFLPFLVREPDESEVEAIVARIQPTKFRPAYLTDSFFRGDYPYRFVHLYLRHKARRAWFFAQRLLRRDPLNFHLNVVTGMVCSRLDYLTTAKYFHTDWRDRLTSSTRPVVFAPLQFYPEARYDYSPLPHELKDIPTLTIRLAELLSKDYTVVFKEHPAAYGSRDPEFYRRLAAFPGTVLVPPFVSPHEVTQYAECVITPGGTVGLETTIRGGRVITIGRPYYYVPGAMEVIETNEDLATLPELLRVRPPIGNVEETARAVIRVMLSQLLPGGCPHIRFDPSDPVAAAEMARFARSLGEYLPRLYERALELNQLHAQMEAVVLNS
jgi:hypothetical protein